MNAILKAIAEMTLDELRAEVALYRRKIAGTRRAARERMQRVRARKPAVRAQEMEPVREQNSAPLLITLGTRYLVKEPRRDFSIAENCTPPGSGPLVLELLTTMNRTLGQLYTDFEPVRGDNRASIRSAIDLEAAAVDPAWAAAELRSMCVRFNRGKHGKGNLPGTLAYFRKGLLNAWSRYRAGSQLELPLVSLEQPITAQRANVAHSAPVTAVLPDASRADNTQVTNERSKCDVLFDWRSLVAKPERIINAA